ncbi:MAG TPA: ROK family protein [Arachnia sp.]|jgi:predicted NBD/HSP70 family sugar kinase|nr:ROK family protein [Propionibacteriaceae bacterium]HMQ65064.1 ROK family protein [Arachnia sp.]HMR12187.1 ROK family protein [Arachnia sp.]HMS37024.1 ROK family protein [Arachnia sp.]HOA27678.1 ROK family protein [Arachnia sp.]
MASYADGYLRHRASTAAVLEFAWDAGAFRADHVISAVGLTRSTALSALDSLIDIGLIQELPNAGAEDGYRMGRPARRFQLRAEAGVVIGVDAGDYRITAIASDLAGQVLAEEHLGVLGFYAGGQHEDRQGAVFRVIDAALASAGRSRADVIGVAVGVPAPVDGDGRSPSHTLGFWQQMNAGLQDALGREFPAVRVENDAALAAVAESSLGEARGCDDFVAMMIGRRLGAGVFLGGQLVRGGHGAVGELEAFVYVSGVGGAQGFGLRAERWLERALEEGRVPDGHPWARLAGAELKAEDVLGAATLDDPVTKPMLDELGETLGRVCGVVARFYDPTRIIVCGAMAGALGDVLELARGWTRAEPGLLPVEIVASGLGGDVVSLGAASAAREAARDVVLPLLTARRAATN